MNRREYALSVATTTATVVAGCLGAEGTGSEIRIDGSRPSFAPGETATITVHAENVDQFRFLALDSDHLEVVSVDVTPSPRRQADSFPPIWGWSSPRASVDAEMEIRATASASAGEYAYEVRTAREDDRVSREFTITVRNESG